MANPGRPRKCDPRVEDLRSNIRQNNYVTAKVTLNDFGIDATDGDGRTALINAIIENKKEFGQWLLDNKANINHQDRNGYTALHFATQDPHSGLVEYLLQRGADPNLQDKYGNSPLWTAIFNTMGDDISIVKTLLKFNANPGLTNNFGASPASLYKDRYNEEISL